MTPTFDDIVGSDLSGAERERLRRVHDLLVVAGRPPELTPRLEQAPRVDENVHALRPRNWSRRSLVLVAAAMVAVGIFGSGYAIGHGGSAAAAAKTLELRGTAIAPHAQGVLRLLPAEKGNWPMTLNVVDLPKLPSHAYYEVYLVRNGKPYASCGVFTVGGARGVTVTLNAPYGLHHGDTWIVTRERPGQKDLGQTVLRPVQA